jgi:hypothetical protein
LLIDSADKQRLAEYQQRFQQRQEHLKQLCRKLRISWLSCSTAEEVDGVLRGLRFHKY